MGSIVHSMYWRWEEALSKEFCNAALAEVDWATSEAGIIYERNQEVMDPKMRRTDVIWQSYMKPLGCIARMYIETANQAAGWDYLIGSQEHTQISRYKSTDEGHYHWHVDAGVPKEGNQRKLSISILLSDPSKFEGGELQFKGIEDQKILTKQGSIVVFPSFIEHRVTPVTKGVRYSAVTWASGPSFR